MLELLLYNFHIKSTREHTIRTLLPKKCKIISALLILIPKINIYNIAKTASFSLDPVLPRILCKKKKRQSVVIGLHFI